MTDLSSLEADLSGQIAAAADLNALEAVRGTSPLGPSAKAHTQVIQRRDSRGFDVTHAVHKGQQLIVAAQLGDLAVLDDRDPIRVVRRVQTMGDRDDSSALQHG